MTVGNKPRSGGGFGGRAFETLDVNDGDGGQGKGDDPAIYESIGALDDLQVGYLSCV